MPNGWQVGFYAFDLLREGNRCLLSTLLAERRQRLDHLLEGSAVRYSPTLHGTAEEVVLAVREHGLEGVIAKRAASFYEPGKRSGAWVKLASVRQATASQFCWLDDLSAAGSLSAGKVRHGFDATSRSRIMRAVGRERTCPFVHFPNAKATRSSDSDLGRRAVSYTRKAGPTGGQDVIRVSPVHSR